MDRPASIRRFEWFWWGATALWAVGTRLAWDRNQGKLLADARTRAAAEWGQWFWIGVTLVLTVLLWWLVARRANVVGKWVVTAWAALGGMLALLRVFSVVAGRTLHPLSEASFLLAALLSVTAAAMLFREDAQLWFGEFEEPVGEDPPA